MSEEKKGFFKRLVSGLTKTKTEYCFRHRLDFSRIFPY